MHSFPRRAIPTMLSGIRPESERRFHDRRPNPSPLETPSPLAPLRSLSRLRLTAAAALILLSAACAPPQTEAAPAPEASARKTEPTRSTRESGAEVWSHVLGDVAVHTYMSPFETFGNSTHIIETANALVVVDPQMTIQFASDFRALVDSLGKPIERLIVSHAHPDHYLGIAAAWEDIDSYALRETFDAIQATGEATRKERVAMFPEGWLADHLTPPGNVLPVGSEEIDGVRYVFEKRSAAEAAEQLVVVLPELGVTVAQDLVYTKVHPVVTDASAIDSWIGHLDELSASNDTSLVLAGHGPPTDAQGVAAMKEYLLEAKSLLAETSDPQEFKSALLEAFPDRVGESFVDFSVFFLFGQSN